MTENALSILIVLFFVELQQTKTSDRKLCIFHHGLMMFSKPCNDRHRRIRDHDNATGICDKSAEKGDDTAGHYGRNTHFRQICFAVPNFNFIHIYKIKKIM